MPDNSLYVAPFIGLGVVLKAPASDGTVNQVIKTDGSGNLSFVTIASGITIDSTAITSGAANQIIFENSSNQVSESSSFAYTEDASTTNTLDIGRGETADNVIPKINLRGDGGTSINPGHISYYGGAVELIRLSGDGGNWSRNALLIGMRTGNSTLTVDLFKFAADKTVAGTGIFSCGSSNGVNNGTMVFYSTSSGATVKNIVVGNMASATNSASSIAFESYLTGKYRAQIVAGAPLNANAAGSLAFLTNKAGTTDQLTEGLGIDELQNVTISTGTLAISGMGSAEVGLSVELASAASADAFNLTSNGGTAGDLFKVDEIGRVFGIDGTAAAPTYSFGSVATGMGMYRRSASGIGFSVASVRRLQITGSDIVNEVLGKFQAGIYVTAGDITVINGEITVDQITSRNNAEGGTAKLTRKNVREIHTLAAASTSDTTAISIPSGARLLGVSFCVNTAVTNGGDDTWSAAFITGSTTSLATAAAAAQNTKVDTMIVDEITSATTQIRFTAQAGSFTAGVIEIVAYYEELTSLANV